MSNAIAIPLTAPNLTKLIEEEEVDIIIRCQSGDKHAYGDLVQKYMKRAYYTALGLVGSHDGALDLSQEAFIRAYRSINKFDIGKKFFTWYYRILKNLCLNYLRDRARHARSFSEIGEAAVAMLPDKTADTSFKVEQNEMKELVWQGLNSLQEHEREVILLKDFQELSYKEIAELMNCPMGTVMSRLYSARKALKSKLERYFDE